MAREDLKATLRQQRARERLGKAQKLCLGERSPLAQRALTAWRAGGRRTKLSDGLDSRLVRGKCTDKRVAALSLACPSPAAPRASFSLPLLSPLLLASYSRYHRCLVRPWLPGSSASRPTCAPRSTSTAGSCASQSPASVLLAASPLACLGCVADGCATLHSSPLSTNGLTTVRLTLLGAVAPTAITAQELILARPHLPPSFDSPAAA